MTVKDQAQNTRAASNKSFERTECRRARLIHLLLGKAAVELCFVTALAVNFAYTNFNPYFRGAVDKADAQTVAGWVVNDAAANPSAPVEVQLYVDAQFAGAQLADRPRPDVRAAGRAPDERHGFSFNVPPPFSSSGEHEARVYAVHADEPGRRRTLQLVGHPRRFNAAPLEEK